MVLHIRVVPPLLSSFVECPLSDSMYWMIGHFRRYVPERLLNAKVVVFLGFLWFTVDFYSLKGVGWWKIGHKTGYLLWNIYDSLEKCGEIGEFVGKSVTDLICSHEKVLNYICGSIS